jgi:starvation-inducible DNA-binding protein
MAEMDVKKTYLAIEPEKLVSVVQSLQVVLANSVFMYSLYKKYHWHVAGEDFYQYHKLFDKHAAEQLPIIDAVAERIRTIGGQAEAMPADVVRLTNLEEKAGVGHRPGDMVASLLEAHSAFIERLRLAIEDADDSDDAGTEDLLVSEVLRVHELQVWFLRSSLS